MARCQLNYLLQRQRAYHGDRLFIDARRNLVHNTKKFAMNSFRKSMDGLFLVLLFFSLGIIERKLKLIQSDLED